MSTILPKMTPTPEPTAIRRLSFYTASPVECCDRCGQGIKYVAHIALKDGTSLKYGMDCIHKTLEGDTSLKSLFAKNAKLLKRYEASLEILNRPETEMPRGHEYFGAGIYFIAGEDGKDLCVGKNLFHPLSDFQKNLSQPKYRMDGTTLRCVTGLGLVPNTPENFQADCRVEIEKAKTFYAAEIARLSQFLGRIIAKGILTKSN